MSCRVSHKMQSESIIQVRNLVMTYADGTDALRDVSFNLKRGEFVAVVGSSGSGKSTMLRCLNRLLDPSSGQILFEQQDIVPISDREEVRKLRRKIAMIFQNFNLIPRLTVLSNVLIGRLGYLGTLKSMLGIFSDEDLGLAQEFLRLMGIQELSGKRADKLSGGQQQRVAIARALMQKPQMILADEPVASLDPASSQVVMGYLKKINQELGLNLIVNLHDLSLVRKYATRVIALKEGQLVFDDVPERLTDVELKIIYGKKE